MSNNCGNNYQKIYYPDMEFDDMQEIIANYKQANYWTCEFCDNTWSNNLVVCVACGDPADD